jgi:hypothetical protein
MTVDVVGQKVVDTMVKYTLTELKTFSKDEGGDEVSTLVSNVVLGVHSFRV